MTRTANLESSLTLSPLKVSGSRVAQRFVHQQIVRNACERAGAPIHSAMSSLATALHTIPEMCTCANILPYATMHMERICFLVPASTGDHCSVEF